MSGTPFGQEKAGRERLGIETHAEIGDSETETVEGKSRLTDQVKAPAEDQP